jgi:large subunit ribosomal protein L16
MGKGKGGVDHWAMPIRRGRVICEISGIDEIVAKKILKGITYKLPMKTKFVKKINALQQ